MEFPLQILNQPLCFAVIIRRGASTTGAGGNHTGLPCAVVYGLFRGSAKAQFSATTPIRTRDTTRR
jgi:hypothetical protein